MKNVSDGGRYRRVSLPGDLRGSLNLLGVRVINLSAAEALIEPGEALAPEQISVLGRPRAGVDVRLPEERYRTPFGAQGADSAGQWLSGWVDRRDRRAKVQDTFISAAHGGQGFDRSGREGAP